MTQDREGGPRQGQDQSQGGRQLPHVTRVRPDEAPRDYASAPCFAHEIDPAYTAPLVQDAAGAGTDVAAWRAAQRVRLRAARDALSAPMRARIAQASRQQLLDFLDRHLGGGQGHVLSLCWPMEAEPDLHALLASLNEAGVPIALPVTGGPGAPDMFHLWHPPMRILPDAAGILTLEAASGFLPQMPDILITPLLGWDDEGYGLDEGNGALGRLLAAISPGPFMIGLGLQAVRLATLHPQPGDIRFDAIISEAGPQAGRCLRG